MSGAAQKLAVWGGASLVALAGHAAVAAIALNWTPAGTAPSAAPAVVMINLEPVVAPQLPTQEVAPGPQVVDSSPQPESLPPEKAVKDEIETPKLPEKPQAVVVLEPPVPQPKLDTKPVVAEQPDRAKDEHYKTERRVASRAAAPTTFEARRAPMASAPAAGAARVAEAAMASWRSELMAQLNRYKRYPSGSSNTGTATVGFRLNRSGQVLSARLIHTSGDGSLDQEAVGLPHRASPLPPPPAGIGGDTIAVTVPVRFGRQ